MTQYKINPPKASGSTKNLAEDSGSHGAEEFKDGFVAFIVCNDPLKLQVKLCPLLLPFVRSTGQDISDLHVRDSLLLLDIVEEAPYRWISTAGM